MSRAFRRARFRGFALGLDLRLRSARASPRRSILSFHNRYRRRLACLRFRRGVAFLWYRARENDRTLLGATNGAIEKDCSAVVPLLFGFVPKLFKFLT